MKGKVIINNQEIEIEINEEQLKQLKIKKKTGYERVEKWEAYYEAVSNGGVIEVHDDYVGYDVERYNAANYYSDKTVAINNARADRLMRHLRRFAVENRKKELVWGNGAEYFYIMYRNAESLFGVAPGLYPCGSIQCQAFTIYFDTKETAKAAIEKFKDELIWYFTEYKDSL